MTGSSSYKKIKTDKGNCKHQRPSLCQRNPVPAPSLPCLHTEDQCLSWLTGSKGTFTKQTQHLQEQSVLWLCLWSAFYTQNPFGNKARVVQSRREPFALGQVHGFYQVPVENMPMDLLHLGLKCLLGCLTCLGISLWVSLHLLCPS